MRDYKKRYWDCVEKGICVWCHKRPAAFGTMCLGCIEKNKERCRKEDRSKIEKRNRKRRERYREENRCIGCGAPLEAEDEGHVKCVNCRIGITRKEGVSYAAYHPQDARRLQSVSVR